jgi:hypothetical protein
MNRMGHAAQAAHSALGVMRGSPGSVLTPRVTQHITGVDALVVEAE